jgi:hypothetical protein
MMKQGWEHRMVMYLPGVLIVVSVAFSLGANASERKAYKIVDEKGNVTYSQIPPNQAKSVQKVDISPASSGRGSNTENRDLRQQQSNNYPDQRSQMNSQQKSREEAEQQRIAGLKAECNRNRGADCENPETLRLIEAQKIPGGRNFR